MFSEFNYKMQLILEERRIKKIAASYEDALKKERAAIARKLNAAKVIMDLAENIETQYPINK